MLGPGGWEVQSGYYFYLLSLSTVCYPLAAILPARGYVPQFHLYLVFWLY